jgi:hypothetical protein
MMGDFSSVDYVMVSVNWCMAQALSSSVSLEVLLGLGDLYRCLNAKPSQKRRNDGALDAIKISFQ